MSDGTEKLLKPKPTASDPCAIVIEIPVNQKSSTEPHDSALELLAKGIAEVLAASPAKPVHKPPLKTADKIPRAILRHSLVKQRKQIENYIKYINASLTTPTSATLTQFFAYFIEQINIAGTLCGQYFDYHKNTSFQNRFPEFVDYLLDAFTYLDENKNHYTLDERMHMLASCKKDFSSTKIENFYKIKDYLTASDAKARELYANSDYEFFLSFHNYCNRLFALITHFESALWQRNKNLTSENHEHTAGENDKYLLQGMKA